MRNKSFILCFGILCVLLAKTMSVAASSELHHSARIVAGWAIETGNAPALAANLGIVLDNGGTLDPDDPYSARDLADALAEMVGGTALLDGIVTTRARGQFGGARRMDLELNPGETHKSDIKLVAAELSWIEARLWRGSDKADIDLELVDADGVLIAADHGQDTGVVGVAALLDVWVDTCTEVVLRVINTGTTQGRVALFIPQSVKQTCEANQ